MSTPTSRRSSPPSPRSSIRATRAAGLAVLQAAPKWDALIFLLDALADPDERVRLRVRQRITTWIAGSNRRARHPTRAQLTRLDTLLTRHAPALPERTARLLRFVLRTEDAAAATCSPETAP